MSKEYSVWLMPEEDSEEMSKFQSLITEYSERYESPDFVPHVTLVGGIERPENVLLEKVQELAGNSDCLEIRFSGSHFSTTRHQCNYLLIDPTVELLEMHEDLTESLDLDGGMYVPHLSLLYSNIGVNERAELDDEIQGRSLPSGFKCSRIVVYDTSGEEEDWKMVEEFRLD